MSQGATATHPSYILSQHTHPFYMRLIHLATHPLNTLLTPNLQYTVPHTFSHTLSYTFSSRLLHILPTHFSPSFSTQAFLRRSSNCPCQRWLLPLVCTTQFPPSSSPPQRNPTTPSIYAISRKVTTATPHQYTPSIHPKPHPNNTPYQQQPLSTHPINTPHPSNESNI